MRKAWLGMLLPLFCCAASSVLACTDFRLKAQDGTVLITRSMEFALDFKSNLISSPRQRAINNTAINGKPALSWKTQYGYVYLDGLNSGVAIDGMNEKGLGVEALYLPGETQYQTVPNGQEAHAIPCLRFGDWVLGNFQNVDEVKKALNNIYVYGQDVPQAKGMIFPLHFAITDHTGKSIIVEFIAGKIRTYDNPLGLLTNSPTYDWQITNLRNYITLSPITPKPVIDNGLTFMVTGQGAGMFGLPGDVSPPSRFVKIAAMLKTVLTPKDESQALNTAEHIINNVDIPLGFVREGQNANKTTNELTQWVVFKDLSHMKFYYRTYGDMTLHSVDLAKINFAETAPQLKMPIASQQYVIDMTEPLINTAKK